MSWYKRAQESVYDLDDNYLNIGHSGFNEGKYGCNYLWFFFKNGSFNFVKETDLVNNHGTWRNNSNLENNYIFKGRIDICKKIASLSGCDVCLSSDTPTNGAREAFCERMKHMCMDNIHQKFGQDIRIREF